MRRKWIGWFAVAACGAFLIPLTPWFGAPEPSQNHIQNLQADKVKTLSSHKEHTAKMRMVQQDMQATALLCTTECSINFRKLMTTATTEENRSDHLAHMMDMHKQMVYVQWWNKGDAITRGIVPYANFPGMKEALAEARTQLKQGKTYHSNTIEPAGHRYMVMAIPSYRMKGDGIVGVVRQDIVNNVAHHQRRNLRLVPYPAEGKYKIESVVPNTLQDTTVNTGEDNANASHYHINEVVVKFRQTPTDADLEKIKSDLHAEHVRKLGYTYVVHSAHETAENMMAYLKTKWDVEYAEPHYLYMTNDTADPAAIRSIVPNDVLYSDYQWNLPIIETEKGWSVSKGNGTVTIGVLDTGVQLDHPDLIGKLADGKNIVSPDSPPDDDVGHGTHVAGIIAANVNNSEGVAGLSWYNKVLPVKVLDSSGAGSTYSVAEGLIWATDQGAKVINMSLGNYAEAEFLHDAIKYAYDHDVVLIAASGNDNTERPGYPAAYPEVLAVASTDPDGAKSSFSNYGDYIGVAAPGASIASTYPGSQYAALSGTSMASPHVAALAGLIRSINPDLTNVEVMDLIRQSAQDLGDKGKDKYFGYGQIDVVRALEAARQSKVTLQNYPAQTKRRLDQIAAKYE
ncbi:type VII secretion-associated serine protease mycosin [Paenibacillus phyllosphaerae]|uniref:Type VII secretion-associated serine protease mycosin n=1 Tax=Paenibacillus phyllosphaerae TaxID=274593 RepID=A0A7W5AUH0_9BACL|nr:S8 family peptidase [Paenibacillus phyllosphaerae]MBB3109020.1 type VII secretion-associated serine protease mycosin [Paenibacillus phyllosphaerae]